MNVVHERIAKVFASRDGDDIGADNRPVPNHVQDRWEIGRSSTTPKKIAPPLTLEPPRRASASTLQ